MQVPSTAPRLGLVLLPGVLLLLVSAAAGTQRDDGQALDASSPQATRVAQTALSYLNYKQGSPSALRTLGYVTKAFVKTIPGVGRKYNLKFFTKDFKTKQNLGLCYASVFYKNYKLSSVVDIKCSQSKNKEHSVADHDLFVRLKKVNTISPLDALALGTVSNSYITWQMSSEGSGYTMTKIRNMKHLKKLDGSVGFDYSVLLHSDAAEHSVRCQVSVTWNLYWPMNVVYGCTSSYESPIPTDSSGMEPGSASGFDMEQDFLNF